MNPAKIAVVSMAEELAYSRGEVVIEGFAQMAPAGFVEFFAQSHGCAVDELATRPFRRNLLTPSECAAI